MLENDQVLLAHPIRDWCSSYNFLQLEVENWLKFHRMQAYNFWGKVDSPTRLCQLTCHWMGVITRVQLLGAPLP